MAGWGGLHVSRYPLFCVMAFLLAVACIFFVQRDLPGEYQQCLSVVWVPWPRLSGAVPRHSMGVLLFFFLFFNRTQNVCMVHLVQSIYLELSV